MDENITDSSSIVLGEREIWGGNRLFSTTEQDRAQHLYCLGKSGTGKTTFLRNLLIQDLNAGRGFALLDVHGDLAEEILDFIPPERSDDVVYFRPADLEFPIGLNPFHGVAPEKRHTVASSIVGAFKGIWKESWGPRMEYVLYAAVSALLENEGTTLLGIQRIFTDAVFRRQIVKQVKDPMVKFFWEREFESWNTQLRSEIVSPIQNKVGQLLMTPHLRNVLGQVKRKVDFRAIMDGRKIFIANLEKGLLGEDKANLLGSLLIAAFQYAALERAEIPLAERVPFTLYVDEFQNYQTESFATILSEARKYGLSLVLSHQFSAQLSENVAQAVFGNVGTIVAFRVGHEDASRLSAEFGGAILPSSLSDLPNFHVYARVLEKGQIREPFLGRTLPSAGLRRRSLRHSSSVRPEVLIQNSRQQYAASRVKVEGKIRKWLGLDDS